MAVNENLEYSARSTFPPLLPQHTLLKTLYDERHKKKLLKQHGGFFCRCNSLNKINKYIQTVNSKT
jgi:redox-regulated HSP33 family molecular chaperone